MSLRTIYACSIKEKTARLRKGLEKIGCGHLCSGITPTPITKGFRSRAKFKVFGNPESFIIKGTDPRRGEVLYGDALWMLPSWGRKLMTHLIASVSDKLGDYWVDGFEVQLSHGNRHAHVTLSVKRQDMQSYTELAEFLLEKIPALEGVSIPSKKQDFGKAFLLHNVCGVNFYSQYSAFFQTNLCLTTRLVDAVKRRYQNLHFYRILDLYCGVGLFSLSIAGNSIPVLGVDINKRAIDSARLSAKSMGFDLGSFLCSPVENFLQNAFVSPNDLIIIDPPRSGCPESLIPVISRREVNNICSISCDLPTHIRDLELWIQSGYAVHSLLAFDMFPFSEFLETVAFLQKRN